MSSLKKKKNDYLSALDFLQSFVRNRKPPSVSSVSSKISYRQKKLKEMKQDWRDKSKSYRKSLKITNDSIPLSNEIKDLKKAKKQIQTWKKFNFLHNKLIEIKIERLRRAWQTSNCERERKCIEFRAKELKERKIE